MEGERDNEKYFHAHDLKIKRVAPAVCGLAELRPRQKTACSGNTAGAQAGLGYDWQRPVQRLARWRNASAPTLGHRSRAAAPMC
jgi:hypothetical protein